MGMYVWSLANNRSIATKKAHKSSCAVVWDSEDYIAEAEKQLSDKNVYRNAIFKTKILQDLEDKINGIFGNLKRKGKITEKNLNTSL